MPLKRTLIPSPLAWTDQPVPVPPPVQPVIAERGGTQLRTPLPVAIKLGEEIVASYLYQTFLYDWLDRNGHGRYLADGDL